MTTDYAGVYIKSLGMTIDEQCQQLASFLAARWHMFHID